MVRLAPYYFSILRPDASDGNQYFGFATNYGGGSFYQAVSTVAGVQHTLSYDLKYYGRGSGPCLIASVYLASNLSNPIAGTHCDYAASYWCKITLTFTPTEADIVVRFTEGGSTRQRDPAIDNVVLTIPDSPPIANAGGPYYAGEGFSVELNGSGSYDPDGNPLTYNWTVSDPGVCTFDDPTVANPNLTCIDNGDFPTQISVNDGTASDSDDTVVYIQNLPPEADLNNNGPINEGDSASVSFSNAFDYSSADTAAGFHYAFDCNGDSLAAETYAGSGTSDSTSYAFADNSSFDVTGRIMDKDDGFDEWATTVTVNIVAPTLNAINVDTALVPVNTAINASADFTDPGTLDMHAALWDWGDGATVGTITQGAGSGSVMTSHSSSVPGVYTVKLIVTDSDLADSNEEVYQYVVVYDPTGGFVTGGGLRIDSPADACPTGSICKAHQAVPTSASSPSTRRARHATLATPTSSLRLATCTSSRPVTSGWSSGGPTPSTWAKAPSMGPVATASCSRQLIVMFREAVISTHSASEYKNIRGSGGGTVFDDAGMAKM